jgi:TupA-like ATPgrasp
VAGRGELDLGLDTAAPGGPLPLTASRTGCLLGGLTHPHWCWGSSTRRVDMRYDVNDVIKFGELSPYPGGGLERFVPATLDAELGKAWVLPRL